MLQSPFMSVPPSGSLFYSCCRGCYAVQSLSLQSAHSVHLHKLLQYKSIIICVNYLPLSLSLLLTLTLSPSSALLFSIALCSGLCYVALCLYVTSGSWRNVSMFHPATKDSPETTSEHHEVVALNNLKILIALNTLH